MSGILDDYRKFRTLDNVSGLERLFDSVILLLRVFSPSFWLRTRLPAAAGSRRWIRDNVIDVYCVGEAALLVFLLFAFRGSWVAVGLSIWVLFEIFLSLVNIVFIGKFPELHARPASIERSILLLFLNLIEVVLAFAIFYSFALALEVGDSFFQATLVLGTVGYPESLKGNARLLVSAQIFLDLTLLVLLLSSFVGQVGLFNRNRNS